jgi:hypothetical protein
MELEFITLDKVRDEAKWLYNFLNDISYWLELAIMIYVHCDSRINK